jgi:hypothetical protein
MIGEIKMLYDVRISKLVYGIKRIDAESIEEAKIKAEELSKNGEMVCIDEEITDIDVEEVRE